MSHSDTKPRIFTADRLSAALHEIGGPARPDYLPDIVAQASRTRQRPALTFLERWLPMDIAVRRQGVPRAVLVFAILALLVTLVMATVAFIGTRPAPPPLTAATNGLLAVASGGDIVVVEPDGTGRRTLITEPGNVTGLAYSPDGERLAYWLDATGGGAPDLVVVDADGSNRVTLASGIRAVTGPIQVAWSPDASTIAYSAKVPQSDEPSCTVAPDPDFCASRIFLAAVDGTGVRQVGDPGLNARGPSWSPDGATIAFGGGNASAEVGIRLYLMNADGSNVRQVSDVRGEGWAFVQIDWSRDGSKIAGTASATDNSAEWDIWVINADGSSVANVGTTDSSDELFPMWAPDRNALAWWRNGVIVLEEGGDPVAFPGGAPVWSPDGKLIATATDSGIIVTDVDGTVQMTVEGTANAPLTWQPLFD
jgi:Tol biopolymer transport system component